LLLLKIELPVTDQPRNPARKSDAHQLPRRWVVERTFGWLVRSRRLARDYERLTTNSETMIKIAMIRLMATRLAGEQIRWSNRTT
jgi:transposase